MQGREGGEGGGSVFSPPSLSQGPFRHEFLRLSRRLIRGTRGAHIQSGRGKNWPSLLFTPAISFGLVWGLQSDGVEFSVRWHLTTEPT